MRPDKRVSGASQAARLRLNLTIVLGTLGGVFIVAQSWLLASVINGLFLEQQPFSSVMPAMWGLVVIFMVRSALNYFSTLFAGQASKLIRDALRNDLLQHLMKLGPAYVSGERSGELSNTLTEGIEALDAYVREFLPRISLAAIIPLTILIVVFPSDTLSGVVLLLTAPIIPVLMWLIGSNAGEMAEKRFGQFSLLSAHFLDVLQGLTTLKLFGRSRDQLDVIRSVTGDFRSTTMEVLRVAFLSALVLEHVGSLATALVAVEIGIRLIFDNILFREALFILILAPEFYLPLRNLGSSFHSSTAGSAAAKRIFEVLQTPVPTTVNSNAPVNAVRPHQTIEFRNVSVQYVEGERPALSNINFKLTVGDSLALVGPSGAGKSTLASLLLRFVEPSAGQVLVDGVALATIPPTVWRSQISWVSQRPYLFNSSLADNIRLGKPDASDDQVREAARAAFLHDFVESLPDAYNTLVGEQGARLSGGQLQRVALARAFLRDAPLLILDEATANLDVLTEERIEEALGRLMSSRTTLIIAHRLNTVRRADRIMVLQDGKIVEEGTHQQLSTDEHLFSSMVSVYRGHEVAT